MASNTRGIGATRAQLVRLQAGDDMAFEEVLSAYEKPIFNHLLRLTGRREEAADLLQETFIRLYDKRSLIDPGGNLKNWLYKVATNMAYDLFRKKKRESLVSIDDEHYAETIEAELSYTSLERDISVIDLEKALSEIKPHYKNILLLFYREGFSYEEIAEIVEAPINTVKTHIRRARIELAVLLKESYG